LNCAFAVVTAFFLREEVSSLALAAPLARVFGYPPQRGLFLPHNARPYGKTALCASQGKENPGRIQKGGAPHHKPARDRESTMNPMPHWYTSLRAHESSNEAIHSFPLESSMKFFGPFTLVVSLLFPCALIAQSTDASLTGLIDDPQKAVIPGVSVTAINTQTGVKTQTLTNKDGQYVLEGLPPGTYRIEVDKQGFKGIIQADLVLHTQDILQINFHMAVGSMQETVTVNGGATNDSPAVSMTVDREFVENMPLNGRSFQDLIQLSPGAVSTSYGYTVDGQRTDANNYTVDGVSANLGGSRTPRL
jgi:hypothetical protein